MPCLMCCVGLQDRSGFAAAVELASSSDIVIAVMGIDQSQEHETGMASVSLIVVIRQLQRLLCKGGGQIHSVKGWSCHTLLGAPG